MSNPVLDVFPELRAQWQNDLPLVDDYLELLMNDTPMIDLRAPCEFDAGSFPSAHSLPLMDDDERKQIGTCYKQKGQSAAIKLGSELVNGAKKQQRIADWRLFIQQHPDAVMYCFRGGMRSQIAQMWLHENGITINRVKGGYKALRRFLLDALAMQSQQQSFITLSGLTGIGKTKFITQYAKHIDLEGLANHKGSVFGNHVLPQPSPIDFENSLSIALLKLAKLGGICLLEDEGNRVGKLSIPLDFVAAMQQSPIVVLEASIDYRINTIYEDYILGIRHNAFALMGEIAGQDYFSNMLLDALDRIKKRLGYERHKNMREQLARAISHHDTALFHELIEALMVGYYDPMYQYQLAKKQDRVVFKGKRDEVSEFLMDKVSSTDYFSDKN